MSYFAPLRSRIEKDIVTRLVRSLQGKGQFNVKVGQQVTPEEIIGNSTSASGFRILDLAGELSVSAQEVNKYLTKNLGQRIYKGELVAFKKGGLFSPKTFVTTPTDGILEYLNHKTGELKISSFPKAVQLPAGVYGIVEKVDQERGQVVIRTQVSRVHGIIGLGRSRNGILHIVGRKDDIVTKELIQAKYEESILLGGSSFSKETITACIALGINGFISGGISARDYKTMSGGNLVFPKKLENDIGISIIICEGFGTVPINSDIFDFLRTYEGRFVFIDGNKALVNLPSFSSSCLEKIKNTQLPPEEVETADAATELKIGLKVRIVGNSYLGEQGKLIRIDVSQTLLPSQVKCTIATVETARRKIQVPVANLEVIM